jgi:mannose-6-phosphate isomerase-like protein (cupin superfamily)
MGMQASVVRIGRARAEFPGGRAGERRPGGGVRDDGAGEGARAGPALSPRVDEVVYGLGGTLTTTKDGATHEVRAGDAVFLPRGCVHHHQNLHAGAARALIVLTPGAIGKGYFEEMAGVVNAGGPPDLARVKEIMLRHGLVPA